MPEVLPPDQPSLAGVPDLEQNQGDLMGTVSLDTLAREVAEFHKRGLMARRRRDLTAEKYALHIDGEGDSQWYDILHGTRLAIPAPLLGAPRQQDNQLRPMCDNMVAHLTTQRYSFLAEAKPSRESREKALIDSAIVNHFSRKQRWNTLWAQAKYIAAGYGSCPIHAMWREELADPYEAVWARDTQGNPMIGVQPGTIDSFVGNPWGTIYDNGATRTRLHRVVYERVLPAELVRQAFGRDDLEGTDRLPSSSVFHRIAAKWTNIGGGVHGTSHVSTIGSMADQELIALLYEEIPPGIDPEYPQGRLCIVALQGQAAADRAMGLGTGFGNAVPLWCGGLPAEKFSFVRVYSHYGRMDDPLGKPYVADLDDDQIALNQALTMYVEYLRRASKAPLATSGKVSVDTLDLTGDTLIEVEPLAPGSVELNYLEQPGGHIQALLEHIQDIRERMYRKGGWQAASRGDLPSGASGKAIISAQKADDSIFGPLTEQTRIELQEFAALNWSLFRAYADVPHIIDLVGDDLAHVAESSVDRTMLSDNEPRFTLTSGFGVTPETDAQQLLQLLDARDYMGEGIITAKEVRELWPDRRLIGDREDAQRTREKRPRVINALLRDVAAELIQEMQIPDDMGDPRILEAAQYVAKMVDEEEPALQDDDLEAHIDTLSLITQDSSEHAVTRRAAEFRQMQYFQWAAMRMAAQAAAAAQPAGADEGAEAPQGSNQQAAQAQGPQQGGTVNSEAMVRADQQASRQARSTA